MHNRQLICMDIHFQVEQEYFPLYSRRPSIKGEFVSVVYILLYKLCAIRMYTSNYVTNVDIDSYIRKQLKKQISQNSNLLSVKYYISVNRNEPTMNNTLGNKYYISVNRNEPTMNNTLGNFSTRQRLDIITSLLHPIFHCCTFRCFHHVYRLPGHDQLWNTQHDDATYTWQLIAKAYVKA